MFHYLFTSRDGSIHIWETSGSHTEISNAHGLDTQAVDLCGTTIVSGSREATLKVNLP